MPNKRKLQVTYKLDKLIEFFRHYLRKIIEQKLCHHLVLKSFKKLSSRIGIINQLSELRKNKVIKANVVYNFKITLHSLKLPNNCLKSKNLIGIKYHCYSSMFVNESTPSQISFINF